MANSPTTVSILSLALIAGAAVAWAQRPPTDLHRVGDHWTAWDPPTEFPAGAEVYLIQPGDTLWDLAGRFHGNPYLWPQLWERNRYILDAHWIYPDDPLVVGMDGTPIEEIAAADAAGTAAGADLPPPAEGREPGLGLGRFSGEPLPLGSEEDLYCSGFIGPEDRAFPFSVIGSEYDNLAPNLEVGAAYITGSYGRVNAIKYDLSFGDIVYVDGGERQGLFPGDQFTVLTAGAPVAHPLSRKPLGRHYEARGRLRLLSVQDETSIAEIIYSCAPVHIGAQLMPFEPEPVPLGRRTPLRGVNDALSSDNLSGAPAIVHSRNNLVTLGQDHVVFIDRGAADDVTPGDLYTIYRVGGPGIPSVVVGQLGVLSVQDDTALAKILDSRYAVYLGDRLSLKSP